jgi:hypothetical protein
MRDLNKRGHLVLGIGIGLLIAGTLWVSGNVWWIDTGWCIGSMINCYK